MVAIHAKLLAKVKNRVALGETLGRFGKQLIYKLFELLIDVPHQALPAARGS